MPRFGCFEIRTSCGSCGQPVQVNGPFTTLSCSSCFRDVHIPAETLTGFFNDFEEDYPGLDEGQGSGGTLMGGGGTFEYGYWRLEPRCSECKQTLDLPEGDAAAEVACPKCGKKYFAYPIPEPFKEFTPSARMCYSADPLPGSPEAEKAAVVNTEAIKPVVMTCPQCGGALSITTASDRISACEYCKAEVYIPDPVWNRLHPVKTAEEWFINFEGKTKKQLEAERRIADQQAEKAALKGWNRAAGPVKRKRNLWPILAAAGGFLFFSAMIAGVLENAGIEESEAAARAGKFLPILIVIAAVAVPVIFVLRSLFRGKLGKGKECKEALAALARKHGWKHEGAEYKSGLGYIRESYKGRDVEIDPADDYAIEVELDESPFYLQTEPPGYPHDGVQRFSTGDPLFDNIFPIRYAKQKLVRKIEASSEGARDVLEPFYWFFERWKGRLGRMKIDWSDVAVHIAPGHIDRADSNNRYLLPEDLEPLLEDMMTLAEAIDDIGYGKKPELPG
jgi:DNA-directed RNA polymerase subunit RPC12/RpoP